MKLTKKQTRAGRWNPIAEAVKTGTAKIYINVRGDVCIDDGRTGPVMPAWLAARVPTETVEAARRDKAARDAQAEQARLAAVARRDTLLAALDLSRCVLLAGEDTDVVASGTLDYCRRMCSAVHHLSRDCYSGKGCWVITAPRRDNGEIVEVESGGFDADIYW